VGIAGGKGDRHARGKKKVCFCLAKNLLIIGLFLYALIGEKTAFPKGTKVNSVHSLQRKNIF